MGFRAFRHFDERFWDFYFLCILPIDSGHFLWYNRILRKIGPRVHARAAIIPHYRDVVNRQNIQKCDLIFVENADFDFCVK